MVVLWSAAALARLATGPAGNKTKPSKPKALKAIAINKMSNKFRKRTDGCYPPSYQSITRIFSLISGKFVWIVKNRRTKLTCDLESMRCKIGRWACLLRIDDNGKGVKHLQRVPGAARHLGQAEGTDQGMGVCRTPNRRTAPTCVFAVKPDGARGEEENDLSHRSAWSARGLRRSAEPCG